MSKLNQLNDTLFNQLEKLSNTELSKDELKQEVERTKAMSSLAANIINNAKIALDGAKLGVGYQSFNALPSMFETPKNNADYLEEKTIAKLNQKQ